MTPKEIAEKYVYVRHNALTDKQEVEDMVKDIEACLIDYNKKLWEQVDKQRERLNESEHRLGGALDKIKDVLNEL
jgi:predicted DNA-binding protein YlxM (UPF0122 family)